MVSVGPGNYVVQAEMPDATGPLQLSMSLVGDLSGEHKVTVQDIRLIRSLKGLSVGQPGYSLAADLTASGTINARDLFLVLLQPRGRDQGRAADGDGRARPVFQPGRDRRGDEPQRDDLRRDGTGRYRQA